MHLVLSVGCARAAAGVTWTCRTASAPWGVRWGHTSVIDAAGAIYVIGGGGDSFCKDVWMSADKGADRTLALGRGVTCGYSRWSREVRYRMLGN